MRDVRDSKGPSVNSRTDKLQEGEQPLPLPKNVEGNLPREATSVYEALLQPGFVGEQRDAELLRWAEEFGRRRAEVLLKDDLTSENLSDLDNELLARIAEAGPLIRKEPIVLERLYSTIRVVQDKTRFAGLREPFQKLGYHMGLCQGREVDEGRMEVLEQSVEKLLDNVYKKHQDLFTQYSPRGEVLAPRILGYEPEALPDLKEALLSALREGEQEGILKRIESDAKAAEIGGLIGRLKQRPPFCWFANVRNLKAAINGMSRQDIKLVDSQFKERTGESLLEAASKTYNSFDVLLSRHVIQRNTMGVVAHEFYEALRGWKTNTTRFTHLREVCRNYTKSELQAGEKYFNKVYRRKLSGQSLKHLFNKKLTKEQRQFLEHAVVGDMLRAEMYALPDLIAGKPHQMYEASEVIKRYRDEDRLDELRKEYLEIHGREVLKDVGASEGPQHQKDLLLGILLGNQKVENAATLRCAIKDSSIWVGKPFLETTSEQRKQLVDDYCAHYTEGDESKFWDDLDGAIRGLDFGLLARFKKVCNQLQRMPLLFRDSRPFVYSVIHSGDMDDDELIRFFMEGIGTDDEGIRKVLAGKTSEEIDSIRRSYFDRYAERDAQTWMSKVPLLKNYVLNGDLDRDIATEVSGDDFFDISKLLEGREVTPAQIYKNIKERFNHETSGKLMRRIKNLSVCRTMPTYKMVSDDVRRCLEYYHRNLKDKQQPSEAELVRFMTLSRFAERSLDAFRQNKSSATRFASNSLAFLGATAGAVPGLLAGAPFLMISGGAIAGSFLVRHTLQKLFSGAAYGREEKFFDALRATIDGGSLLTMRLGQVSAATLQVLGRFFGASIGRNVMKSGVKMGLHTFIKSVENRIRKQDKARHILDDVRGPLLHNGPEKRIQDFLESVSSADYISDQSATQASRSFERAFREGMWLAFRGGHVQ